MGMETCWVLRKGQCAFCFFVMERVAAANYPSLPYCLLFFCVCPKYRREKENFPKSSFYLEFEPGEVLGGEK